MEAERGVGHKIADCGLASPSLPEFTPQGGGSVAD